MEFLGQRAMINEQLCCVGLVQAPRLFKHRDLVRATESHLLEIVVVRLTARKHRGESIFEDACGSFASSRLCIARRSFSEGGRWKKFGG